jgi:hypothetical protein
MARLRQMPEQERNPAAREAGRLIPGILAAAAEMVKYA